MNQFFLLFFIPFTGLLGSFPSAYIAGKCKGVDIRQHGSGNMGATNSMRILGKGWGIAVLAADALKGFLAAWVGFLALTAWGDYAAWGAVLGGIFAVVMHTWNPWFKFKPVGKGVACGLGAAVFMVPQTSLVALAVFVVTAVLSRYISLASVLACLSAVPMCFVFQAPLVYKVFVIVAVCFIVLRHWGNMKRLFAGNERRVEWSRKRNGQAAEKDTDKASS